MFFVKKKEGSLRLVQDYRKLNEITVKSSYPLPLVSDVLTRLRDAEWFTTLDLHWGFNNVQLREGDEWKAAFSMNRGLFEPLIMFFGLCNSPATFQTMMNNILCPFVNRNEAICYMDDIGESPGRYSRPFIPISCFSDQRNANLIVERWITSGLSSPRSM